jgi:hypothetical protein
MASDDYRKILEQADLHFTSVMQSHAEPAVRSGLFLCCYGLFEIGSGDVPVIAEGLENMHPSRRRKVIRRAGDRGAERASEPPRVQAGRRKRSSIAHSRRRVRISTTRVCA